jgi:hypothetical protein
MASEGNHRIHSKFVYKINLENKLIFLNILGYYVTYEKEKDTAEKIVNFN